jgi:hypothetical protein
MTLVLSYDPRTNITCGFLGYVARNSHNDFGSHLSPLIPELLGAWPGTTHPLLLPTIAFGLWSNTLQADHISINFKLRDVQRRTGLMNPYLTGFNPEESLLEKNLDYNGVHKDLVLQHSYLSSSLSDFVSSLSGASLSALDEMIKLFPSSCQTSLHQHDGDLRTFVLHTQGMVNASLQNKERMLNRVDMQLKVVCHSPIISTYVPLLRSSLKS